MNKWSVRRKCLAAAYLVDQIYIDITAVWSSTLCSRQEALADGRQRSLLQRTTLNGRPSSNGLKIREEQKAQFDRDRL